MLPGAPKDLSVEAQNLINKVTTFIPPAEHDRTSSGLQDRCPACGVGVPLTDVAVAICSNGHRWRESSITSDMHPLNKLMSCWSRGGPPLPFLLTLSSCISSLFCNIVYSLDNDGANLSRLRTEILSPCRATSVSTGWGRRDESGCRTLRPNHGGGSKHGWRPGYCGRSSDRAGLGHAGGSEGHPQMSLLWK